jgi:hypothetical protein
MIKFLFLILLAFSQKTNWRECQIEKKLWISFPQKPQTDNSFKDLTSYLSKNSNCDFSVDVSTVPSFLLPKTENERFKVLERAVELSKNEKLFISSKRFCAGGINGIELKQYSPASPSIKLIQVSRTFFYNQKHITLSCLNKGKNTKAVEEDSKRFFSSLITR